ncbi:hypothetical protein ACFV9E_05985 [Streptomyces sp. NPDC059835]|uniref:hypothetical protein n=1 Tax=Streptomyces sp. NPDC059835 TaxID=3346967 RepID=UPI00366552AF
MGEDQMNKHALTRAGVAAAGAALLVGGLTACGGAGAGGAGDKPAGSAAPKAESPADAVKASYVKTAAARFARFDMTFTGADGKPLQLTGTKGWYPAATGIDAKGGDGRQVMLGDVVYTAVDKPVQGKSWMKMNLNKDGKPRHQLNDDPAEYLALLLGQQKLTLVGAEQPDGVEAKHYKAALTGAELLAADESTKVMDEANRRSLHEALKDYSAIEVDLWIGKDGYPLRVDTSRVAKDGTTKVSAKFSGYGTAEAVSAPPADQVVDFDDVMKGVDKSLKETDQKLKDAGLGGLDGS